MSKHTPGPWSVSGIRTHADPDEKYLQIIADDGKKSGTFAYVCWSDRTNEDFIASHADARLIAAAPEMLAALKEVFGGMVAEIGQRGVDVNFPLLRAAIEKAEGRS